MNQNHPSVPTAGPHFRGQARQRFAQAFTTGAGTYSQVRPTYPVDAVEYLLESVEPTTGPIVELGAGSGQLTSALLEHGYTVIATEPSPAMVKQLQLRYGKHQNLQIKRCTAEETFLPDAQAAAVVCAQAWHWFHPAAASAEALRISQPGAPLGLIWNQLDVTIDWVHRLSRIMHAGDVHGINWRPPVDTACYSPGTLFHTYWVQHLSVEQIIRLAQTRTFWLQAKEPTRKKVEENIRWYLTEELGHGSEDIVALPYRCTVLRSYQRRNPRSSS